MSALGLVMAGNEPVRLMVCTPAAGMLKTMVVSGVTVLMQSMAQRRVLVPASALLVTVTLPDVGHWACIHWARQRKAGSRIHEFRRCIDICIS